MKQLRKHYTGCYRMTLSDERFAQIRRVDGKWLVEVRKTHTGDLVRYAGLWNTRRDAVEEAQSIWA